jgi:hypothetical protein
MTRAMQLARIVASYYYTWQCARTDIAILRNLTAINRSMCLISDNTLCTSRNGVIGATLEQVAMAVRHYGACGQ